MNCKCVSSYCRTAAEQTTSGLSGIYQQAFICCWCVSGRLGLSSSRLGCALLVGSDPQPVFHPLGAAARGIFFYGQRVSRGRGKNRNTFKTSTAVRSVSISMTTETSHVSKLGISGVGKLSSWSRGKEYLLHDGLMYPIMDTLNKI